MTIAQFSSFLNASESKTENVLCLNCYKLNDSSSVYCKYCGHLLLSDRKTSITGDFEREFLRKLEEKTRKRNRRILIFLISIVLFSIIGLILYFELNSYLNSDTYKFNTILKKWRNLYQEKDTSIAREIFDDDYQFVDKNNRRHSLEEVFKRLNNEYNISIKVDSLKIQYDENDSSYVNLTFSKLVSKDKNKERSSHTLRLVKQNNQWKIFREYSRTPF